MFFSCPRLKLGGLQAFATAKCVKVNPDSPQKQVRYLALSGILFNTIQTQTLNSECYIKCNAAILSRQLTEISGK
jgi:hypothetical protein